MIIGLKITCILCIITPKSYSQEDYQRRALKQHNSFRLKYHAPPLYMDNALNNLTSKCALYYAKKRAINLSCRNRHKKGENIWMGIRGQWTDKECVDMSLKSWVDDEAKYFNFEKPYFSPRTGHFTQVVWKNSRKLGFACARSGDRTVAVALYSPSGNYHGEFQDNVLKP